MNMDALLRSVKKRFIATILLVVAFVVGSSWAILQWYSSTELDTPAHISEVHRTGEKNEAFASYLQEQKDFEAHFITLATDIKRQEAERVTRALGLTTAVVVLFGAGAAVIAARKLIKPVEEAYRSQERFIQDAAHELRNPLAAMTAALQQTDTRSSDSQLIKTFQRQTKRLIHINEDLLFLERRADTPIRKISLTDLLGDVVEELYPLAASRNVTLVVNNREEIEKTMSQTDYIRLVKNVIDNAIKYSFSGKKVYITQKKLKGTIEIVVKDHGIGIPIKDQSDIGSRFYRASNTGKVDGTGLGLAIVQKILNVYGGSREIISTPNKGTTVTLRLPA
jgi:two-component system, OmpR family, Ni(II)-sensor and/or redox sensor kinase NrsS